MMESMTDRAEAEIVSRHRFFVDWYTGKAPDSAMDTCARTFAPDMRMIWPDATEHDREPLIELLRKGKNSHPEDFAIEVDMRHSMQLSPELVLVTFDEHQNSNGERNSRRATAVFSRDDNAPEGVVWRYLHQTWMT